MDNTSSMYPYVNVNWDAVSFRPRAKTLCILIRVSTEICRLGEVNNLYPLESRLSVINHFPQRPHKYCRLEIRASISCLLLCTCYLLQCPHKIGPKTKYLYLVNEVVPYDSESTFKFLMRIGSKKWKNFLGFFKSWNLEICQVLRIPLNSLGSISHWSHILCWLFCS